MKNNGYYGIGIERGKTEFNYWTLFRTAQIFDCDFLFVIGEKYKRHGADTMSSYKNIPVFSYKDFDDFKEHRPFACKLVGIEMTDSAIDIKEFVHPRNAIYILGSEDNGLSRKARDVCNDIIKLPGEKSLNVSVAGSIVLFDRLMKKN